MVIYPMNMFPMRGEPPPVSPEPAAQAGGAAGESELGFWDILDVVNPLQHLPVIGAIYRHFTGDEISAPARIAGGLLFGGPIGMAASAADVGLEAVSGDDLGGHVFALLDGQAAPADGRALAEHRSAASAYGAQGGGGGVSAYEIDIPA
ncbi:MAG: hypothetical protein TEF_05745 [Rhizobiales bacterium NRL2]|jgi:hypothetical protein|nr:MAG: hypothetical protein TEF_05745 [Rhizobiales bacterium NRL2]